MRPLDIYEKDPSKRVTIYFEGTPLIAYEGEKISVALLANGIRWISISSEGRKRGAFAFGPALVKINGIKNKDARKTKVKDGMRIERQTYLEYQGSVEVDKSKLPEKYVIDVAIVGGGIVGIGATLELQDYLTVALIEEKGYLGGDMRRKSVPVKEFDNKEAKEVVKDLVEKFNENVKVFKGTTLLGIYRDGNLFLLSAAKGERLVEIYAKKVILATGAVDNFMLFENNEMPGVFRRDFALELINVWGVKPGNKIAVVGRKPEDIVPELERVGIEYIIVKNPKRVEGKESVERIIDIEGNVYEVDAVIMSDGRRPDINPITLVGGKIIFKNGAYVPVKSDKNEIIEGVYVAGSASSLKNHYANYLEGRLVARYILNELGVGVSIQELKEEFEKINEEIEEPLSQVDLSKLNLEETYICGCDVTLKSVVNVVDGGITNLQIVKRLTHLAMGFCQGRYCLFNGAVVVSKLSGIDMDKIDLPTARPPLKPVTMKVIGNE
ncbi:FAD-dependent oxidoreductase [Thermococcus barophilus]|uniref:Sarcosine oxidase, alpha subunit n=1 Tax=Thermococcus barophilus TaxID=55802 RepID=A0A0S1XBJ5_THEBA|nr:FAD-dependent oxidoreductase [Thermococcus barophilus]ALM75099.1 Sarcosine oxidase, alpha subunit [Thermococcus barophilus]